MKETGDAVEVIFILPRDNSGEGIFSFSRIAYCLEDKFECELIHGNPFIIRIVKERESPK